VTFQQVRNYESGKNRVGASPLHLIATALDVRSLNSSTVHRRRVVR
jgi:hypothetical protein